MATLNNQISKPCAWKPNRTRLLLPTVKGATISKRRHRQKKNSEQGGARRQGLTRPEWKLINRPFKRAIIHFPEQRSYVDIQL